MSMFPPIGQRLDEQSLQQRLEALAELVRIGRARQAQGQPDSSAGGFAAARLDAAESVLTRAAERLRLSSGHTVVALAGGTGSGKSALFNALSGVNFSPSGVTRPATRHPHACVWGVQGAVPLLDWLGVERRHRYARASVLDSGEADLDGLVLLDLPDHDSVVTASMASVDRLAKLADMVIWVLDPQKYADASLHNRYLIPLASHTSVFTVVLNQVDLLDAGQVTDCAEDLRRLLDSEGLTGTAVLPVSARTGAGLAELRALLAETVRRNRAATDRIAADIDAVIGDFAAHAGPQVAPDTALTETAPGALLPAPLPGDEEHEKALSRPPWEMDERERAAALAQPALARPPWEDTSAEGSRHDAEPDASVPRQPAEQLTEAFVRATGVAAVAQALASAREAQAARLTGWPASWLLPRRHDPVRALRGGGFKAAGRAAAAAVGPAQQAEVDNAITAFADSVGGGLPEPWAGSLRVAARCNASMVPRALADAVHAAIAAGSSKPPLWWRLVAVWQWLLTLLAVAGLGTAAVIVAVHGTGHHRGVLSEASLIPWLLLMAAAVLMLGLLTAVGCRTVVAAATERERESATRAMRERVTGVAHDLVLLATGREIAQYERFRREVEVASGTQRF